ncbi:carnitine operon oxidoreductase CaiA [Salmonella enterica subsp. enterica]|uniref:Carnitine operon oxidoreductase CaiA n=1 Tax=Salmonella enterica I TaxID=59201 RepID=A0A3S5DDA9_SALET|nr:carnitine operon oxidoreductase CaiA [Salmonella enterica subsp. enterica]
MQFGEAIGRFQLIQEKFAHMAIKLNSMKNMLLEAAWKADNGTITSGDAAMCKYFCANAAFEVVDTRHAGTGRCWYRGQPPHHAFLA